MDRESGLALWDLLVENGAAPVGLGARDTLRLEATAQHWQRLVLHHALKRGHTTPHEPW